MNHQSKRTNQPAKHQTTKVVLFNKPFNTLCQFTGEPGDSVLADYIPIKQVYAAGRLDKDSEGLLLLTNNGILQHKITDPRHKQLKTYWVQVENIPSESAIEQLSSGVELKDGLTQPAIVSRMSEPNVWPRTPPVRERKNIPTCWLEIKLTEGKNRQVRRMTAAIGHPTLRLIRAQIGKWCLGDLKPGEYKLV